MTVNDLALICFDILYESILFFSFFFVLTGIALGMLQTVFSVQDPGLPTAAKLVVLMILIEYIGADIYNQFYNILDNLQ